MPNISGLVLRLLESETEPIECLELSNDQSLLAVGRSFGAVQILETSTFNTVAVLPGHREVSAKRIRFLEKPSKKKRSRQSPFFRYHLLKVGVNGVIEVWNIQNQTLMSTSSSGGGPAYCLDISEDKPTVAVGCEDGSIRMFGFEFDVEQDSASLVVEKSRMKTSDRILSLCFGTDENGKCLYAGTSNSTILKFDTKSGAVQETMTLPDREEDIRDRFKKENQELGHHEAMAFSSGKKKTNLVWDLLHITSEGVLVSADSSGFVTFWDSSLAVPISSLKSHQADVMALGRGLNGDILSAGRDGRLIKYSKGKRKNWIVSDQIFPGGAVGGDIICMKCMERTHKGSSSVHAIMGTYSGDLLAVEFQSDLKKRSKINPNSLSKRVYFSPKKNLLMTLYNHRLEFWQLKDHKSMTIKDEIDSGDESVMSENFQIFESHSNEHFESRLPHTLPVKVSVLELEGNEDTRCAAFSHDGNFAAVSSSADTRIFEIAPGGAAISRLRDEKILKGRLSYALLFLDGGILLSVVVSDGKFYILAVNYEKGKIVATSKAFKHPPHTLHRSDFGNYVLVVGPEEITLVLDAKTLTTVFSFSGFGVEGGQPISACISPDEKTTAIVSSKGNVVFCDIESQATLPNTAQWSHFDETGISKIPFLEDMLGESRVVSSAWVPKEEGKNDEYLLVNTRKKAKLLPIRRVDNQIRGNRGAATLAYPPKTKLVQVEKFPTIKKADSPMKSDSASFIIFAAIPQASVTKTFQRKKFGQ
eukprot:GHVP01027203.1.p1 GENE.GHVP01027203.1~~GHVP01027203.1.p1  ORF type:complete len:758 (-),score=146.18 GHVP01027203.1:1071-3344(-)